MIPRINRRRSSSQHGIALIVTLIAISMLSVLGMALALSSSVDRLAAANHDQAVSLLNLADAALELASRDLAGQADWTPVLAGTVRSTMAAGPPGGLLSPLPGVVVDLTGDTNELTCGDRTGCTNAAIQASTADRPWGANNPRWQPFVYGVLDLPTTRLPDTAFVVVWLGDDGSETDGDPLTDGGGPDAEGRYILRARAEAFGVQGGRRAIEAELARLCQPSVAGESCLPGIRVQSWRLVGNIP